MQQVKCHQQKMLRIIRLWHAAGMAIQLYYYGSITGLAFSHRATINTSYCNSTRDVEYCMPPPMHCLFGYMLLHSNLELCCVKNVSGPVDLPKDPGFAKGGANHGKHAQCKPTMGVWGWSPSGVQEQSPCRRSGAKPLEAERFYYSTFSFKGQSPLKLKGFTNFHTKWGQKLRI